MREEVRLRCRVYGEGRLGRKIVYILRKLNVYLEANECFKYCRFDQERLVEVLCAAFSC